MQVSLDKLIQGYRRFRDKYAEGGKDLMYSLARDGQSPEFMILSCCDSRVDPSLLFQCHPGDLFIIRNVANILPPFESDNSHHGTSTALEYGVCYLKVKHLIILGHSQCGGIDACLHPEQLTQNDFISDWVSLVDLPASISEIDDAAKQSLLQSYEQALTFPWIKSGVDNGSLQIHLWFFDIKNSKLQAYSHENKEYLPL